MTKPVLTIFLSSILNVLTYADSYSAATPVVKLRVTQDSVYAKIDTHQVSLPFATLAAEIENEKHLYIDVPDSQVVKNGFRLFTEKDTLLINSCAWSDSIMFISDHDTICTSASFRIQKSREQYLERLQNDGGYTTNNNPCLFTFSYQKRTDPNLVKLRNAFNLDSVAGKGDEISKIVNLMKWAHQSARHDGSSTPPQNKNALDLIKFAHDSSRGINCWMLGIILKEAYLSMGFASRHVWCNPLKDTSDHDCHVVIIVYSKTMKKWIMMDPTFQAYFMDSSGTILSLQEIRDYLRNGKALKLNKEINWNGQPLDPADHIRYMTKNVYQFQCSLASEFDSDSKYESRAFAYLVPCAESKDPKKVKWQVGNQFYTTNPNCFWAKP